MGKSINLRSKIVLEKDISTFDRPSPEDYWESQIEYKVMDQDSNLEIIVTNEGKSSIYKYGNDTFKKVTNK